jgi:hypothetical protein
MIPGEPFFVGYLKLPPGLRGFLASILAMVALADIGLALVLVFLQPPHASGAWGQDGETTIIGRFLARPYPLVLVPAGPDGPARAVLLVSEGKHGAPAGLESLDGLLVEARGYPVRRGSLTLLQLDQMPSQVEGEVPPLSDPLPLPGPPITGEIVDSKCFAGAMNPGEGKAHKGCGAICLIGGIPPLLVTDTTAQDPVWYLLEAPDGGPADPSIATFVGERVRLEGTVVSMVGLKLFRLDPGALP